MIDRRHFLKLAGTSVCVAGLHTPLMAGGRGGEKDVPPNIILCMTDDQGWGDTGYNGHPILKTPNLDHMAKSGIRFDRFYAAAPVCSPTRGSVLTGRHPERYNLFTHGQKLNKQETTIAQVLKKSGYTCGHFGKWHLNGVSGVGKPISKDDEYGPAHFGFDHWFSVSNYFDLNTTFSRNGEHVKTTGDGSDAIVSEALDFIASAKKNKKPFLAVIWYGSPHVPLKAMPNDKAPYGKGGDYLGELAAVDRSIGTLRTQLRRMKIADDTLIWFCSDNGPKIGGGDSTKGLRGKKLQLYEGGIRVPAILEWPGRIKKPFTTQVPCTTSDMFPTLLDSAGIKNNKITVPMDGINLSPLIDGKMKIRPQPIAFKLKKHSVLIDNDHKLHVIAGKKELYRLSNDESESKDLAASDKKRVSVMDQDLSKWRNSVKQSAQGDDYKK